MGKVVKMVIEIETTNASFEQDFKYEIEHILNKVACVDEQKLLDSNGNVVGIVKVETE